MVCGSRRVAFVLGCQMIALITRMRLRSWFAGSPVRPETSTPLCRAMTAGPAVSASRFPIALFLLGIALRLPGLLFNGMADVYQILLEWGAAVHHLGLVDAFGINYGILSVRSLRRG